LGGAPTNTVFVLVGAMAKTITNSMFGKWKFSSSDGGKTHISIAGSEVTVITRRPQGWAVNEPLDKPPRRPYPNFASAKRAAALRLVSLKLKATNRELRELRMLRRALLEEIHSARNHRHPHRH
jgi:hypothetical protein